ncbi:MAG: ABC transporter permease [Propionibacteriaceae bacterium]|nr:ABC transporter permease [Propionibacteriaceae bacterium]
MSKIPASVRWLLSAILFLFVLTVISFLIVALAPGDAAMSMLNMDTVSVTRSDIEALRNELGLNDPLPVRYVRYVNDLMHGSLGNSLMTGKPVVEEIAKAWPYTQLLALWTLLLVVVLAFGLAALAARYANTWVDRAVGVFTAASAAMPSFWLALLLIDLFAVKLGWLPSSGMKDPRGLILPVVTLAIAIIAPYVKILRDSFVEASNANFVRSLRSRGVPEAIIGYKHILRDSLIPLITLLGVSLGSLLGGTIVIEVTFGIPGVGKLAIEALARRDYGIIQGFILIVGIIVFVINALIDLAYRLLDPALSHKAGVKA